MVIIVTKDFFPEWTQLLKVVVFASPEFLDNVTDPKVVVTALIFIFLGFLFFSIFFLLVFYELFDSSFIGTGHDAHEHAVGHYKEQKLG